MMKEYIKRIFIVFLGSIFFFCKIPFMYYGLFNAAYFLKEKEYYSDSSNFITSEAIITNIIYSEDSSIILWLSEIDTIYPDNTFIINEQNAVILMDSGFATKVHIGDKIIFTSAPGCYTNGYMMPIVALSIKDEQLLNFDEGYENFIEQYYLFFEK